MTDDADQTIEHRELPRPGERGWSSTGWPDSAGQRQPDRAAAPTPPDWADRSIADPAPPERFVLYPPEADAGVDGAVTDQDPTVPSSVPDKTKRIEWSTASTASTSSAPSSSSVPSSAAAEDAGTERSLRDRLDAVADRVAGAASVERLDDSFSLRRLFANSFRRRPQADVEAELMVGTAVTTPPLSTVTAEWPQPWLFARTLLATGVVFALFLAGWTVFGAITLLPGLIIVGSFAMPVTALLFFFEVNLPKNVSVVAVLRMVFLGGTASLLFSLLGFELFDFPWLGAMVAGLIEEPAKLLAVVLVARRVQHRFVLNGMLFGAAIGAGFAAFESAGYALVAALFALDNGDVIDNIVLRGLLSPFGHVVWTAITAGALWRVKGSQPLRIEHLRDPRFWRVMVLAVALHTAWSSPIPSLFYVKFAVLGAAAWLVCFSLLQEGIGQVREEQGRVGP